jgi:hypothetical protein
VAVNVLGAFGRDAPCAHELRVQGAFGMDVHGVIPCLHMNDTRTIPTATSSVAPAVVSSFSGSQTDCYYWSLISCFACLLASS